MNIDPAVLDLGYLLSACLFIFEFIVTGRLHAAVTLPHLQTSRAPGSSNGFKLRFRPQACVKRQLSRYPKFVFQSGAEDHLLGEFSHIHQLHDKAILICVDLCSWAEH